MVNIKRLTVSNLEEIVNVERLAFIPPIQATAEEIQNRLRWHHTYLGAFVGNSLVGTAAFRYAEFVPIFSEFISANPTFEKYANYTNKLNANAAFFYSLGVIPEYRNGLVVRELMKVARLLVLSQQKRIFVADSRIPSYNGSFYSGIESIKQRQDVRTAVDELSLGVKEKALSRDPVLGFYMRHFPQAKILGVTDSHFLEEDYPSGGHEVIIYERIM